MKPIEALLVTMKREHDDFTSQFAKANAVARRQFDEIQAKSFAPIAAFYDRMHQCQEAR